MVIAALLALVSLVGVTTGLTIGRDISPFPNALNVSIGGITNPISTLINGIPSSGSSLTRRSYRKSAPYADPHSIDPSILVVADDLCKDHKTFEDGDYYCQKVDQVIYTNVGSSGEYKEVVYMDHDTGECRFADVNRTFSGDLAPFNEPVSPSLVSSVRRLRLSLCSKANMTSKGDLDLSWTYPPQATSRLLPLRLRRFSSTLLQRGLPNLSRPHLPRQPRRRRFRRRRRPVWRLALLRQLARHRRCLFLSNSRQRSHHRRVPRHD